MKKLNYYAPICGTGYGLTSKHILKELSKKLDITLFDIGGVNVETQEEYDMCSKLLHYHKSFDPKADCLKIWHQFELAARIGSGKYYGFPIFELDKFTDREKNNIKCCDHIMVCSHWAKQIVENNNISMPTSVVPLGIDSSVFTKSEIQTTTNNYVFLNIGKWEIRKGHDILIECFTKAFNNEDNVELWMVPHNPFLDQKEIDQWLSLVKKSKLNHKIKIFNRLKTQKNIAELINHSSCGVYLSRAEGWNLELLESICMNKPVIATNYSGHTEFCNTNNSFLVDINETEVANDNKWFFGNGNWAKIGESQKDQIISHMRYCYTNNISNNTGYIKTKNTYTWENSAKKILECIT